MTDNTITQVISRATATETRVMAALATRKVAESEECDGSQYRIVATVTRRDIVDAAQVSLESFDGVAAVRGGVSLLRVSWEGNGVEDQYDVGAAGYVSVIVPECDHWTVRAISLAPSATSGAIPADALRPDAVLETFNIRAYREHGKAQSRRNTTIVVAVGAVSPVVVPIPPGSVRMQALSSAVLPPLAAVLNLSQTIPIAGINSFDWHVIHSASAVLVGPAVQVPALVSLTFTVET